MQATPVYPNRPQSSDDQSTRMRPWNWVLLILGVLITALGLVFTAGGAVLMGVESSQQDGSYVSAAPERFQTTGYAITAPSLVIEPGETGLPGVAPLEELASVQIRITPVIPDQAVFVGIADLDIVTEYLDGVPQATIGGKVWDAQGQPSGQWSWDMDTNGELQETTGDRNPEIPVDQTFWEVSSSGTGTQEITFDLQPGTWGLVVMNADATRPVWVDLEPGFRTSLLDTVNPVVLIGGLIGLLLGIVLLLLGAAGLGRDIDQHKPPRTRTPETYPLSFTGVLDEKLSRGLWLIKWLMAVPHYLILAFLWFALVITTIVAGLSILFTGRYPRSLFAFSVGVLRWNWRVGFYTYSALGTDRYPPFTLASKDYPAALEVDYPERLSHGLVLVKWWLLALPHWLIVGILAGSVGIFMTDSLSENTSWGLSLLGVLVLIVAVTLLFTGRYPRDLFALIIGVNRWIYRVLTYVLLLHDQYPPFRLDQGPADQSAESLPDKPGDAPATPNAPS